MSVCSIIHDDDDDDDDEGVFKQEKIGCRCSPLNLHYTTHRERASSRVEKYVGVVMVRGGQMVTRST